MRQLIGMPSTVNVPAGLDLELGAARLEGDAGHHRPRRVAGAEKQDRRHGGLWRPDRQRPDTNSVRAVLTASGRLLLHPVPDTGDDRAAAEVIARRVGDREDVDAGNEVANAVEFTSYKCSGLLEVRARNLQYAELF